MVTFSGSFTNEDLKGDTGRKDPVDEVIDILTAPTVGSGPPRGAPARAMRNVSAVSPKVNVQQLESLTPTYQGSNVPVGSLNTRFDEQRIDDIVMENFNVFKQYCDIAVMVNPMTNNWFQMKDFVDFCNKNDVYLGYNTVRYPKHLSIQHMPVEMIEDVYLTLHKQVNTYPNKNHNWKRFEYLVETQIKNWMLEKWNG